MNFFKIWLNTSNAFLIRIVAFCVLRLFSTINYLNTLHAIHEIYLCSLSRTDTHLFAV
jgi:hypothetical protein